MPYSAALSLIVAATAAILILTGISGGTAKVLLVVSVATLVMSLMTHNRRDNLLE
jgi:uncharacterized membrane protein YtjA (UPF0391 family)